MPNKYSVIITQIIMLRHLVATHLKNSNIRAEEVNQQHTYMLAKGECNGQLHITPTAHS